jgi:heme/copper-type cytochrome/quinol oxidase subunit 2
MHDELDFTIILMILSVAFSPMIVGLTVLFYIKSRQTKEIHKTKRGTFQEIFGLK